MYSSGPMTMDSLEVSVSVTSRVRAELTVRSGTTPVSGSGRAFMRTYQPSPVLWVEMVEKAPLRR